MKVYNFLCYVYFAGDVKIPSVGLNCVIEKNTEVNFDLMLFASFFSFREKNEVGVGASPQEEDCLIKDCSFIF